MNIENMKKQIKPEHMTQSVIQWFDSVEKQQDETIEEGLIIEFEDVYSHPTNPNIWKRFIQSLNFLIKNKPYYEKTIAPVNLLQQLNLVITDKLSAPMAVSLLHPDDIFKEMPKFKAKQKPYLLINPEYLFLMLIRQEHNQFDDIDLLFDRTLGILVHETYHISRGDLLLEIKYHYSSEKLDEKYKKELETKQLQFLDENGEPSFNVNNIYTLNNILMDASINMDIYDNIHSSLMPKNAHESFVSEKTTISTVEKMVHTIDASKYQMHTVSDFYSENIHVMFKQYGLLKYLETLPNQSKPNNQNENDDENDSDNNENKSNQSFNKDDLLKKHSKASSNQTEEEAENTTFDVDNLIKTSNINAQQESNNKSYDITPSHGLRDKILKLHKAKKLPKFDFKVKGIIKDFNNMKKLNYNFRHIAYPTRLDMCRHHPSNVEAGFHVYMDVSGSVSLKVINNIFNILIATTKDEPAFLYVFASNMTSEPLEIKKNTRLQTVIDFIEKADVGYGTQFKYLLQNIVEHPNEKHIIFSDYYFNDSELKPYVKQIRKTPIIHVIEDESALDFSSFLEFARQNTKYNKILKLKDYTL